jgi:hypothetical protein
MDEMIVIVCSVCGEPASGDTERCPVCSAVDQRAVPESDLSHTREERLLTGVQRTLESLDHLRVAEARSQVQEAQVQKERVLRMRLEAQAGALEARLRAEPSGDLAVNSHRALQRIRHELYRPSL